MPNSLQSMETALETVVEDGVREMEDAYNAISTPVRTYLIAAVALALAMWNMSEHAGIAPTVLCSCAFLGRGCAYVPEHQIVIY